MSGAVEKKTLTGAIDKNNKKKKARIVPAGKLTKLEKAAFEAAKQFALAHGASGLFNPAYPDEGADEPKWFGIEHTLPDAFDGACGTRSAIWDALEDMGLIDKLQAESIEEEEEQSE